MNDVGVTCCFTGHRPQKLPWRQNESDPGCISLKAELDAALEGIYSSGYRNFLCGMAIGCDMYYAEAVLKLRERCPDVRLTAVVPCREQADKWNRESKRRYERILSLCDEVKILQEHYSTDCMQRRNRYMVDNSSLLLACFDGCPGGTMSTILYAQRHGLKVICLDI